VTNTRRITLSVEEPEFPPAANYREFAYLVCGRRFDPNRVDQRIPLGAVEEWTVVNEHNNDHIIHIHTNPFQLVTVNGEKLAEPDGRDTVVVPRKGSVTFRTRFLGFHRTLRAPLPRDESRRARDDAGRRGVCGLTSIGAPKC
jgi:FtsP/CotA-like multicopper oxidase with cupredoxin domain